MPQTAFHRTEIALDTNTDLLYRLGERAETIKNFKVSVKSLIHRTSILLLETQDREEKPDNEIYPEEGKSSRPSYQSCVNKPPKDLKAEVNEFIRELHDI